MKAAVANAGDVERAPSETWRTLTFVAAEERDTGRWENDEERSPRLLSDGAEL